MSLVFLILSILLFVVSGGFTLISIWRLQHYIRAYRFEESHYTLFLGFLHLKWISGLYVLGVLLMGAFSLITFWTLLP